MPRRKATEAVQDITPAQAHYILGKLLEDKRVSVTELAGYLRSMEQEIRQLEQRLSELKASYGQNESRPSGKGEARGAGGGQQEKARKAGASRKPITEEQRASRQLQGQYMSLIRRFPAEKRAAFKAISKESGRQAAVDRMRSEIPS